MKKFLAMMMCSFIALGTLAGCSDEGGSDGDTIKIGVNYEQSGAAATYGQDHVDGIKIAVDEINAAGGIDGKKLELVIKDNKSDSNEVINVSTSLISEDNVVAILGPATSGATKAAISVANKQKVPTISASATTDDVTYNKDGSITEYGFKICFSDSYQGKALAKFTADKGKTKAVILGDASDPYGKGLAKSFSEEFTKDGGTVVAEENYTSGDTDFSAVLTKIKGYDFDVLFVPGYYQEAGPIVRQAREAGIDTMIIGPDGFDSNDFISLAGESNLNDVYFSTHFTKVGDNKAVVEFVEKFKKEYDKEPGCFNALGYDLAYYIADAIKRCDGDVTSENITKALADSKAEFTGVTGTFTMGKDHTPEKSINVVELKDGVQVGAEEVSVK